MALGTWKSPFPFRLGAGSTRMIQRFYDRIHANLGDAISQDPGSVADVETKAAARLLSLAERAKLRRIIQADPRKLTEPRLSRWESILGIIPSVNDSDFTRRYRVAARLLAAYTGGSGSIDTIVQTAFYPWTYKVRYHDVAHAATFWLGSTPAGSATDWYSTVALITIEYLRPAGATNDDVNARCDSCRAALDEYLPAWATFCFSETLSGYEYGFRVGVSRLGHAALTEGTA